MENINLYTKTRGVNRFVGLVRGLESVNYQGMAIDNLKKWIDKSFSLSIGSLQKEFDKLKTKDLKKALEWSEEVNEAVANADGYDKAFPGAKDGLAKLAKEGTVHVVSTANREALESEWTRHGLMEYVEDLYCQDKGKKEDVIASLIEAGTSPENIVMIGDSPGDLKAAELNKAWFYPIIVGNEEKSWDVLREEVVDTMITGDFTQNMQEEYTSMFWSNLEK